MAFLKSMRQKNVTYKFKLLRNYKMSGHSRLD